MASADEKRAAELAELARQWFLWLREHELPGVPGSKGLTPSDVRMFAGAYRAVPNAGTWIGGRGSLVGLVDFWGDAEEQRRLRAVGAGAKHVLLICDPEVQTWDGTGFLVQNELYLAGNGDLAKPGAIAVNDPALDSTKSDAATLASWKHYTFAGLIDRVDLGWDDAAEAARAGFDKDYRWIFDYETPRRAYRQNVRDLIPIEPASSLTEFREYLYWYATYKNRRRASERGGDYYAKWKAASPDKKEQRIYRPTFLSTDYLRECFREYVLQRNCSYLLIAAPGQHLLYYLTPVPAKGTKPATLNVTLALRFHDLAQSPDGGAIPRPMQVVIFYAYDGGKHQPAPMGQRGHADLGGVASGRYAYDYKAAVRWFFGKQLRDPGEDFAWFSLFERFLFPDAIYPIDGTLRGVDSCTMTVEQVAAMAEGASGTIKDRLAEIVAAARQRPDLRFVVKGTVYGDGATRRTLIGVSAGHVYEWYPVTALVTRMEVGAWCRDNELAQIYAEIYAATRHVIPLAMVVTWGGLIVAGGAIVGGGMLATLARSVIRDLVKDLSLRRGVKELARKHRAQLVALVVDGILMLFPRTDDLYFELIRGFVHGFGAGAVSHYLSRADERVVAQVDRLYHAALNKLTFGADRAYQLYLKISVAIHKLTGVFHALRAVWTPEFAIAARAAFTFLGRWLGLALLICLMVVVYVDYVYGSGKIDQVKRDTWARHQRDVLKLMIKETGADLAAYAEVLREDLSGSPPDDAAVRARNDRLAASIVAAVMKAPTEAPGMMDLLREILAELGIDNWQELADLGIMELLGRGWDSVLQQHPGLMAEEARTLGEALGELIGTFFLERAMMPARWRKGSITGNAAVDKSVRKSLAAGTVPALWKFARSLLTQLAGFVPRMVDDVREAATEHGALFERVRHADSRYQDFLKDLIQDERQLANATGALAMDPTLPQRLREIAARAATESPPGFDEILSAEVEGWPRDAVLFVLQTWLHVGLLHILRAFDLLEDDAPFQGKFRLSTLLEIAGLDVSLDDKTAAALAVTFG